MKKLVSLVIAIMLVVSLLSVTTVAFAAEGETGDTERTIVFNREEFAKLSAANPQKVQALSSAYIPDTEWLKDAALVNAVFEGANYVLKSDSGYAVTDESDTVKLQYLTPNNDYKDDAKWSNAILGSTIPVNTPGVWGFRYLLVAKGSSKTYDAKTDVVYINFSDNTAPVFTGLTTSMKNAQQNGIKVGSSYTIRTDLNFTESSSKTVTYVVYKKVNGAWTSEPIYDSKTKEVAEGYENSISASGVITMQESDVLADKEPIYKIVYTAKDAMGYVTDKDSDGNEIAMTLFAVKPEAEATDTYQIVKIVLYCIAGVALVGIVVVLFIKPKDKEDTSAKSDNK